MLLFEVTEFWNQLKVNKNSSNKRAQRKQISSLTFYHSFVILLVLSFFLSSYLHHDNVNLLKGFNGTISFIIFNEHLLYIALIKSSIIHISKECELDVHNWYFSFIQSEMCLHTNYCRIWDRMISFVNRLIHWSTMVDIYNYNISLRFSNIRFAALNKL